MTYFLKFMKCALYFLLKLNVHFASKTKLCGLGYLCAKMPNELGSTWTYVFFCFWLNKQKLQFTLQKSEFIFFLFVKQARPLYYNCKYNILHCIISGGSRIFRSGGTEPLGGRPLTRALFGQKCMRKRKNWIPLGLEVRRRR